MMALMERLQDIAVTVLEECFEGEFRVIDARRDWSGLETVTALVRFSEAWYGAVATTCSVRLARGLAAFVFEIEPESVGDEEIGDAMGEVANRVGGHVKQVLPEGTRLSVPTIHAGDDVLAAVPGGEVTGQAVFDRGGEQIIVTVYASILDSDCKRSNDE